METILFSEFHGDVDQVFPQLKLQFFGLLSFSTAWSFIKAPATCRKLCNCGDFLLKKKNCHRGRQPTHQGSAGPNVWGSCEEHTRRDDWSLGHLEKYNLRNFQFPHEHIQQKSTYHSMESLSVWQGFNTSNIGRHYNKTSMLYVYDKNGVIICLQGQGKCPF